jgi:tetratricopeptide (TPR) repeat protein
MLAYRSARVLVLALVATAALAHPALGQAPSASAPPESSVAIPAPTIPTPQPTTLPAPEPTAVAELEDHLTKLAGRDDAAARTAMSDLADSDATALPAISAKLVAMRKTADRDGMTKLLDKSRRKAKGSDTDDEPPADKSPDAGKRHHKEKPAAESADKDPTASTTSACDHKLVDPSGNDPLGVLLAAGDRDKPGFKDLVTVLALQRACVCIGTTAAARELVNVYTYFGDLFRPDVQRQLERMGDSALPALIEAKYHDSRMVRTWAERRLDVLGKVIPGEAVRTADNQVLADILRAYGRAREVEAVRVIVTYANSDRLQVREAAREAIGQIGEPAKWQLREAFENLAGKKAEQSWDWKRIAIELFSAYDRARLSEVYSMAEDGFARYKEGKLDEAIKSFDRVLARAPGFARKTEMVPAYLEQARAMRDKDRVGARASLRRAELLDPTGPNVKSVQSEQALLDAEELSTRGIVDVSLLKRAVELDPANARARAALERAEHDTETRQATWRRYAAAVAIGVIALAAMLFIALVPRRRKAKAGAETRPAAASAPPPARQTADEPPAAFPDPPSRSERP